MSEKINRYDVNGRYRSATVGEWDIACDLFCKSCDVSGLEIDIDEYKSDIERQRDRIKSLISQLSQITEERDRAIELLEEAERLLRVSASANYENKQYYKDRDAFLSSLTKENE